MLVLKGFPELLWMRLPNIVLDTPTTTASHWGEERKFIKINFNDSVKHGYKPGFLWVQPKGKAQGRKNSGF